MIAVEDDARKRLEKLSQFHTITPVDMTKLAADDTTETNTQQELVEENPAYSTSMPVNSKGQHIGNGHVEMADMNGLIEKEPPKKSKDKGRKDSKASKSSSTGNLDSPLIENVLVLSSRSQNSLNQSFDKIPFQDDGSFSDHQGHMSFDVDDSGPYREMAIDCPDNFPSMSKTPPRLPNSKNHSPHAPPSTPYKKLDHSSDRTENTLSSAAVKMSNGQHNPPLSEDQMERLRKHQEELRKRREEETQRAKEQEFLRTSLRGSKKLQALEKKKQMAAGVVNTAFDDNEDDFDNVDDGLGGCSRTPSEKDRYMKKNVGKFKSGLCTLCNEETCICNTLYMNYICKKYHFFMRLCPRRK